MWTCNSNIFENVYLRSVRLHNCSHESGYNIDGALLKRIEEAKPCEDLCLAGLTHFSSEEHFVHHSVHLNYNTSMWGNVQWGLAHFKQKLTWIVAYLVEVKNKVQFANVAEILVENFDEIVNGFEISEIIIPYIHTDTKVEPSITPINNFIIAELKEGWKIIGLTIRDKKENILPLQNWCVLHLSLWLKRELPRWASVFLHPLMPYTILLTSSFQLDFELK